VKELVKAVTPHRASDLAECDQVSSAFVLGVDLPPNRLSILNGEIVYFYSSLAVESFFSGWSTLLFEIQFEQGPQGAAACVLYVTEVGGSNPNIILMTRVFLDPDAPRSVKNS
jgi:hypothetical protein